jgi:hypothetical protein
VKYRVGDFLIVESSFKSGGNIFHREDILRVVTCIDDYAVANENGYVISNKSWIFSQEGHSVYCNSAYSFGRNTNWFVRFAALEAHCTLLKEREWE